MPKNRADAGSYGHVRPDGTRHESEKWRRNLSEADLRESRRGVRKVDPALCPASTHLTRGWSATAMEFDLRQRWYGNPNGFTMMLQALPVARIPSGAGV